MDMIESNNPVSTDGRVTEASMQQRIEDKIFNKGKPEVKADTKPETPAPEAIAPEETADPVEAAPKVDDDEYFEHEIDGEKWKLPKKVKPALDGYQDYTKKTMEAADRQRHADAIIEQATLAQQMQSALQPKYEAVSDIDRQIKQYENVDWNTWIQTNPVEAQKGMLQLQVLRDNRNRAAADLQTEAQRHMQVLTEKQAKLRDENMKVLQRELKNWNADSHKSLLDFAGKAYGFSDQETSKVFDSRVLRMMADAQEWRKLQESKPQVAKQAAKAAGTLRPGAADQRNAKQVQQASLKREIKSAKTDQEKAKGIERWLTSRV
jgi:hypothetical protein